MFAQTDLAGVLDRHGPMAVALLALVAVLFFFMRSYSKAIEALAAEHKKDREQHAQQFNQIVQELHSMKEEMAIHFPRGRR